MRPTAATEHRDPEPLCACGPKRALVDQGQFTHGNSKGFRGHILRVLGVSQVLGGADLFSLERSCPFSESPFRSGNVPCSRSTNDDCALQAILLHVGAAALSSPIRYNDYRKHCGNDGQKSHRNILANDEQLAKSAPFNMGP